jgi:hypothetical protein
VFWLKFCTQIHEAQQKYKGSHCIRVMQRALPKLKYKSFVTALQSPGLAWFCGPLSLSPLLRWLWVPIVRLLTSCTQYRTPARASKTVRHDYASGQRLMKGLTFSWARVDELGCLAWRFLPASVQTIHLPPRSCSLKPLFLPYSILAIVHTRERPTTRTKIHPLSNW